MLYIRCFIVKLRAFVSDSPMNRTSPFDLIPVENNGNKEMNTESKKK